MDLLNLQNILLEAAVKKTAPGRSYLSTSEFKEIVGGAYDQETLVEMLRELVGEGILQLGPAANAENSYCVTEEYLASLQQ